MYYEDLFTGPKIKPISMVYLYNDKECIIPQEN